VPTEVSLAMLIEASQKGDGLSPQQHLIGTTHATAAAVTTAVVVAAITVEDSAAVAAAATAEDSDPAEHPAVRPDPAELDPADSEYISTAAPETPATGLSPFAVVTAADFVVQVAAAVVAAEAAAADSVVVHSVLVAQSARLLAYDNSSIAPAAPDASSDSTAVDFDSTAVDSDSTAVDFAVAATAVVVDSIVVESVVVVVAVLDLECWRRRILLPLGRWWGCWGPFDSF